MRPAVVGVPRSARGSTSRGRRWQHPREVWQEPVERVGPAEVIALGRVDAEGPQQVGGRVVADELGDGAGAEAAGDVDDVEPGCSSFWSPVVPAVGARDEWYERAVSG